MRQRSIRSSVVVIFAFGCACSGAISIAADADAARPYAGQQTRAIKALSAQDVEDYLSGKGIGLAKAAELNGYPGPAHVLALAEQLRLSTEQKQRTQAIFHAMETQAQAIGAAIVDEEKRLDHAFATNSVSSESLAPSLKRIGELQAQLRQVHLEAHLAQTEILGPEQLADYAYLRGYQGAPHRTGHGGHKH